MKKKIINCLIAIFAACIVQAQESPLTIVSGPTVTYLSDNLATLLVIVSNEPDAPNLGEHQTIRSFDELDDYLFNLAVENQLDEFHYDKTNIEFVDGFATIKIRLSQSDSAPPTSVTSSDMKIVLNSGFLYPLSAGSKKANNQIIHKMKRIQPRAVIWMGNTLYYSMEDAGNHDQQFTKNINFRLQEPVSQFFQSSSHFAIWNDRDFAPENWDNSPPDRVDAQQLFDSFWPVPESVSAKKGIYKHTRMGDTEFFFLDHLYFEKDGVTQLGAHQLFWLKEKLYKSTANFKFIVSGTSFLSTDASVAQIKEKDEVLDFIKHHKINGVLFLSSALPYTELSVLESEDFYPLHEFSCASLTDMGIPIEVGKNSLRVSKTAVKKANFGLVNIKQEKEQQFCWFETYDQAGSLLWTYPINLTTIQKKRAN